MLPLLLPVGAAVAGAASGAFDKAGEAVKDFANAGKNKFQATPYQSQAVTFGGGHGAHGFSMDATNGRLNAMDQANYAQAQMRGNRGPQAIENQGLANREASAGAYQQEAVDLSRQAALGNAPSVAARQMQAGLDSAVAGQRSAAASARGSAGLAMAQSNAQANTANLQNQTFNQAAQLRAAEMAQARGQYQQGTDSLRAAAQARLGQSNQNNQFNAQLNDQYRLGMGQLGVGFQNSAQGWHGQAMDPWKMQMGADMQRQQIDADSYNQAQAINAGVSQSNADARAAMRDRFVNWGVNGATNISKIGGK